MLPHYTRLFVRFIGSSNKVLLQTDKSPYISPTRFYVHCIQPSVVVWRHQSLHSISFKSKMYSDDLLLVLNAVCNMERVKQQSTSWFPVQTPSEVF
jgi:hypothetical protein